MLKIGIIGYGFVGKAMHKTFEHNAEFVIVDPKISNTTIADLINHAPNIIFVCLPAPTLDDGSVDAGLIYSVFSQLSDKRYSGLVVVKSTIPPAIAQDLFDRFGNSVPALRYIYSPEFLRESSWKNDAVNPDRILLAGNFFECKSVEKIYKQHSHIRTHTMFVLCDYKEAALVKYATNVFLASKVVFFNQLHELYNDMYGNRSALVPDSWNAFVELMAGDLRIGESHMSVPGPDGNYGYGGTCFPKDMKALHGFDINGRMTIAKEAELSNTKIRLIKNNSDFDK